MGKSISIGLKEAERQRDFKYDAALMSNDGVYSAGHIAIDQLVDSLIPETEKCSQIKNRFKLLAVHECEEAKRWLELQSTQGDFHSVRVAENDRRALDCAEAIDAITKLIQIDDSKPYFLRNAFSSGLASVVEESKGLNVWWPDPNMEAGGEFFRTTGRIKRFVESQFAMRTGLFSMDTVLRQARTSLQNWTEKSPNPWNWLGNLYCDPSLSRKSRSRITKDSDANLGVAVLGLSIALSSMFRHLVAGRTTHVRHVGDTIPIDGRPCWEIVAAYINCSFSFVLDESAESVRQRCYAFSKGRRVHIHNWAEAAIRQPQVQEK
jgi:hypothetical protein